jgi:hypothetical protein
MDWCHPVSLILSQAEKLAFSLIILSRHFHRFALDKTCPLTLGKSPPRLSFRMFSKLIMLSAELICNWEIKSI